jgi:predicted dehydrogenase
VQATAAANPLAQSAGERGDIEDAAAIVLRFANGAVGSTSIAWTRDGLAGKYSLDVLGSESSLHLELDPDFTLSGVSRGQKVEAKTTQHPIERSVARFFAAAREGDAARVFCTPRDAVGTLAAVIACEQALDSGGTVPVQSL